MKRFVVVLGALLLVLAAGPAVAWELHGHVYCEGTGLPVPGVSIQVTSTDGKGFDVTAVTDESGAYLVELPTVDACYEADIIVSACDVVVSPAGGGYDFCANATTFDFTQDFVISGCSCQTQNLRCWLTGGGQAERGDELFSYGGNVNPGCSPTAGQGGQWTVTDMLTNLHFEGIAIEVLRCGNVDGIPAGSTSPKTPFNFIEFQGTGRAFGVQGNKADYPLVYFFGRAEDRHEPGSMGQRDTTLKDRLYLNVYTNPGDPAGSSILLIDGDGDPATVDPLAVLHGNLNIHVSSCTAPPPAPTARKNGGLAMGRSSGAVTFASPGPNPASSHVVLRFALSRPADVSLGIYDITGRLVRGIAAGASPAGEHAFTWDLRNQAGQPVPNGVYFARIAAEGRTYTQAVAVAR